MMKTRIGISLGVIGLTWVVPVAFGGDVILGFNRCGTLGDSLSTGEAVGRRAWANKYYSANPTWKVYYKFAVNFADPRTNTKMDLYPSYGVFQGGKDDQGFDRVANPRHYQGGTSEGAPANLPEDYTLVAMCVPSCFAPGTQLATSEFETQSVDTLAAADARFVLTPKKDIAFDQLGRLGSYQTSEVGRFISDLAVEHPVPQEMVDISFKSGGNLSITPDHSVLTPVGSMKPAKRVEAGDLFVRADGSLDEVVSIAFNRKSVRVHNLVMMSQEPVENLVVSNGYLTGTYYFQEKQVEFLNRQIFRENLPDSWVDAI